MSTDAVRAAVEGSEPVAESRLLKAVSLEELLAREFPPREMILEPAIPTQGLAMIYGPRGVGKTHVALGIAYAVATGGQMLRFNAPKARRCLYVDGEMPACVMQDRLAQLTHDSDAEPPTPDFLTLITPDLQEGAIPDLASRDGQEAIEQHLEGVDLVVLDNLSSLLRSGRENEAESWLPVQEWSLSLRRMGVSVLFIHHAGKGGQQRGTSRREDVLDTVLALKRPGDYLASEGARFEVHYEKSRGVYGEQVKPFEATLQDGGWAMKDLSESRTDKVAELLNEGVKQRDIAEMLGINPGTVSRHAAKARSGGLVDQSKVP